MASKLKTEVKKEPDIEVKVEEKLNLKAEFKPEVKKMKRKLKEEETEDYFSSPNFPKTTAKISSKLASIFVEIKGGYKIEVCSYAMENFPYFSVRRFWIAFSKTKY